MSLVLVVLLGALFVHIHYRDIRKREIPFLDLALLCGIRLLLFVITVGEEWSGQNIWWGCESIVWDGNMLVQQSARGLFVAVILCGINKILSRKNSDEALGAGDIKLYFVCCLFLDEDATVLFLLLSTCIGVVQGGVYWWYFKERTFPFAPALVWSCYVSFLLRLLAGIAL